MIILLQCHKDLCFVLAWPPIKNINNKEAGSQSDLMGTRF